MMRHTLAEPYGNANLGAGLALAPNSFHYNNFSRKPRPALMLGEDECKKM